MALQSPNEPRQPAKAVDSITLARRRRRRKRITLKSFVYGALLAASFLLGGKTLGAMIAVAVAILFAYEIALNPEDDLFITGSSTRRATEFDDDPIELSEEDRALQAELIAHCDNLRRFYQYSLITFFVTIGVSGASVAIGSLIGPNSLLLATGAFAMGILTLARLQKAGDRSAWDVQEIINRAGMESLGGLAHFLESSDLQHHPPAIEALIRILGSVRPTDAPSISLGVRRYLYRFLRPGQAARHPDLALGVIRMAEQLADGDAAPYLLDLLAETDLPSRSRYELHRAAQFALEGIGQADEELGRRGNLLSPAAAPEDAGSLLRPAAGQQAPPEQLLRTANSSDGD